MEDDDYNGESFDYDEGTGEDITDYGVKSEECYDEYDQYTELISNPEDSFIRPKYMSQAWNERFDKLEFRIDNEGYLYSPKLYNESWDDQTKAVWLRSVGFGPTKIARYLCVNKEVVEIRWIIHITGNYKLRSISKYDWATIGYVDKAHKRWIKQGGAPDNTDKQLVSQYQLQNRQQLQMDIRLIKMMKELRDDSAEDR